MEERQDFITEDMLKYLDNLRTSGATNMFGAGSFVERAFPELEKGQANKVLGYWMDTFGKDKR